MPSKGTFFKFCVGGPSDKHAMQTIYLQAFKGGDGRKGRKGTCPTCGREYIVYETTSEDREVTDS
jgi:hypothetical protein